MSLHRTLFSWLDRAVRSPLQSSSLSKEQIADRDDPAPLVLAEAPGNTTDVGRGLRLASDEPWDLVDVPGRPASGLNVAPAVAATGPQAVLMPEVALAPASTPPAVGAGLGWGWYAAGGLGVAAAAGGGGGGGASGAPSNTSAAPRGDVIDLGQYGKLIAPVQVDGNNWYYYWDRSGDGTSSNTGSLNGGLDYTTHDVLDGIFTQDVNGNVGGGGSTTDVYRWATLNGVKVALPTANGGLAYPNGINAYQPGTAIDSSPAGESNVTYNDLLAIWDGHNGTGTGTIITGTPSGWQTAHYWSATPSAFGHASVYLDSGYVLGDYDWHGYAVSGVALQVL